MFFASEPTARGSASGYTIDWIDRDFDHGFRLHRWTYGSEVILAETDAGLADPPASWHVQVQGDVIRFFADGQLIFDVADSTYREGYFGVWDYGNGGQIRVDDVRIGDIFRDSFTGRSTLTARKAPHAHGFELSVSGEIGGQYRLQATDDLGTANWIDLFSFRLTEGTTNLLDPSAPAFNRRFYRVISKD